MGTIANAKVTHYYNCYNGDFIGCLQFLKKRCNEKLFVLMCFTDGYVCNAEKCMMKSPFRHLLE